MGAGNKSCSKKIVGKLRFISNQSKMGKNYNYLVISEVGKYPHTRYNPNFRFCRVEINKAKYPQDRAKWDFLTQT